MLPDIDSYVSSLTETEKRKFFKEMKKKFEEENEEDDEVEDDPQYERRNLDKFYLFQKKNYFIYILSKRICDILFSTKSSTRGYVYGGFIRDNILHDFMANKFYENNMFEDHELFEKYNDPKVDSELSFRTLVPKDIDMRFYSHTDYMVFLNTLKSEGYKVIAFINDVDSDKYKTPKKKDDDEDSDDEHEVKFKLEVKSNVSLQNLNTGNIRLIDKEYAATSVIVDITITEKRRKSDFLCNSVRMSIHGLFVYCEREYFGTVKNIIAEQKNEMVMMELIEEQIHNMEAVVLCSLHIPIPDRHRIIKMANKGWKIKLLTIRDKSFLTQITSEDDDEDHCIICHEKFETMSVVPGVHTLLNGVKFNCCSASYHCHCLVELLNKDTHLVISRDKSSVAYKCIQCSQVKMNFYKNKMIEFLDEMTSVFYEQRFPFSLA